MTRRRTIPVISAAALAAASLAMAPVLPAGESTSRAIVLEGAGTDEDLCDGFEDAPFCGGPSDQEGSSPLPSEPCDEVEGATVITPDAGFDGTVPTPVGVANEGEVSDAGLYQVDLSGLEEATAARVRMTLSWDTPAGLGDYDLVVDGHNELSTASPESHTRTLGHCGVVDLEVVVFTGTPLDTLQLTVEATPFSLPS